MIETQVNPRQVARILESFSELPNQVIRAKRRAIKITTRQVSKDVKRGIATANRITQKLLGPPPGGRGRVRTPVIKPELGIVWVGYNDMAFVYMGKPRNRFPNGVDFRGVNYPHAFVARMQSGHVGVFERQPPLTHWSRNRKHTWQPNLPIRELAVPLNGVAEAVVQARRIESGGERLEVNFARELNYEVNVRPNRNQANTP
jgi:hypothetical protein